MINKASEAHSTRSQFRSQPAHLNSLTVRTSAQQKHPPQEQARASRATDNEQVPRPAETPGPVLNTPQDPAVPMPSTSPPAPNLPTITLDPTTQTRACPQVCLARGWPDSFAQLPTAKGGVPVSPKPTAACRTTAGDATRQTPSPRSGMQFHFGVVVVAYLVCISLRAHDASNRPGQARLGT